jgi:hypothetical protein
VIAVMRNTPSLADIPTVVISAQDQLDQDLALDGDLSVRKPDGFRLDDLLSALEALLAALPPTRPTIAWPAEPTPRRDTRQRKRLRAPTS